MKLLLSYYCHKSLICIRFFATGCCYFSTKKKLHSCKSFDRKLFSNTFDFLFGTQAKKKSHSRFKKGSHSRIKERFSFEIQKIGSHSRFEKGSHLRFKDFSYS